MEHTHTYTFLVLSNALFLPEIFMKIKLVSEIAFAYKLN